MLNPVEFRNVDKGENGTVSVAEGAVAEAVAGTEAVAEVLTLSNSLMSPAGVVAGDLALRNSPI